MGFSGRAGLKGRKEELGDGQAGPGDDRRMEEAETRGRAGCLQGPGV